MTTPRDDIAGLSERLREQTRHWTGIMSRHPAFLDPELSITMMEAATQLDSLSARVMDLEARPPLLDARSIKGVDELVKTLEAHALRAEQERDEAYERAALIALDICNTQADGWQRNPGADRSGEIAASNCGLFTAQAIRRLASGPEKEKKE